MSLPVILQPEAEETICASAAWWAEHRSVEQALRWYDGFLEAIDSLGDNPKGHPVSRENHLFAYEIRDLYFGLGLHSTHRAIFAIQANAIVVLTTRHLAQRDITAEDLPPQL